MYYLSSYSPNFFRVVLALFDIANNLKFNPSNNLYPTISIYLICSFVRCTKSEFLKIVAYSEIIIIIAVVTLLIFLWLKSLIRTIVSR